MGNKVWTFRFGWQRDLAWNGEGQFLDKIAREFKGFQSLEFELIESLRKMVGRMDVEIGVGPEQGVVGQSVWTG